jgi:hypothetical protein
MVERFTRDQVLAYRAAAQGLHREATGGPAELAIVDLGVQDTPAGSAAMALAVRGAPLDGELEDGRLVTTWSVRGAPHIHRAEELVWWSRAVWPWSDVDALARLHTGASPMKAAGMSGHEALRYVAEQLARIVTAPMPKGEASTALTPHLPAQLTVACRSCEATHVMESVWRCAVLPAGFTFVPGTRTVTFQPVPGWPGPPAATEDEATLFATYLRLHGPARPAEVAAFIGTTTSEVKGRWPDTLVEVEVDGTRRWAPADVVPLLSTPPDPPSLRLLPPLDPWLQARDREFVVPDAEVRSLMWPILGRPGAVLVRGEVAGRWRARKQGRRLALTVEPFVTLPRSVAHHLDDEAQLVAQARGCASASVELVAA